MKKLALLILALTFFNVTQAQEIQDLFKKSETKIYWLGIDFSHVKLIGDFNQFAEWGNVSTREIRNEYFPDWNDLFYKEESKYDVAGMVRKSDVIFHTDPVFAVNKNAVLEEMETRTEPEYSLEDIQSFVNKYKFDKEGLGMMMVAESLNKFKATAKYHFVVINMKTNEILLHQHYTTAAGGFGMRNYWAKTIFNTIKIIKDSSYFDWKKEFGK